MSVDNEQIIRKAYREGSIILAQLGVIGNLSAAAGVVIANSPDTGGVNSSSAD
jgi:hypothetical protein